MQKTTTHNSTSEFLSIQDVASLVGKSIQTIRRLVKSKKLKTKKKKTPQGFRYLIERKSVLKCFEIEDATRKNVKVQSEDISAVEDLRDHSKIENADTVKTEEISESQAEIKDEKSEEMRNSSSDDEVAAIAVDPEDFKSFVKTLDNLVIQHSEERQNFLRLVNTLQEQVFVLENKINMLQAPKKKWYKFWA